MKFVVQNLTKCAPRAGIIKNIERLPNFTLETPMAVLYTKGGSIPHITREVMHLVTKEPQCIQIPLVSTANFYQPMAEYEGTLADFVGLTECLSYVTVQDPGDITPSGHHLQNNVPIFARSGKMFFNPDNYMDTMESFKPDMYCLLSDGDTNMTSSKKRIAKSVDQTLSFVTKCLERHHTADNLKHSMAIAAVEGGYCLLSRQRCIDGLIVKNNSIGGYLIDGLHNNGPEVEFLSYEEIKPVVEKTISLLPEEKMRVIHGCWNPLVILKLVSMGVDVFDTSYLYIVTERSAALTFNFDPITEADPEREYEINFRNAKYSEEFSPIVEGCTCLTCSNYSRAYVQHLTNVQELLGPVLLNIHNIHHYLEFFKRIRTAVAEGTLELLTQLIKIQVDNYLTKLNEKHFIHGSSL